MAQLRVKNQRLPDTGNFCDTTPSSSSKLIFPAPVQTEDSSLFSLFLQQEGLTEYFITSTEDEQPEQQSG